jgi:hypothetical protein
MNLIINFARSIAPPIVGFLFGAITILVITFVVSVADVYAQQNWIKCQHLSTGAIQMHPGSSCPANWAPV